MAPVSRSFPRLTVYLIVLVLVANGATVLPGERRVPGGPSVGAMRAATEAMRSQAGTGSGGWQRVRQWFEVHARNFWRQPEGVYVICTLLGIVVLLGLLLLHSRHLRLELRRHQVALEETEARWHFALDSSELGVFDWDVARDHVVYSEQYEKLLGYESGLPGGPIGQWEDRLHPDDLEAANAKLHEHLRGESPYYSREYRMRVADGSYRWFLARGKVLVRDGEGRAVRHLGTLADISERKAMELELQHAKDLLEQRVRARTAELAERVAEVEQINRAMGEVLADLQATNRKLEEVSGALESTNQELDAFAYSVSHDLRAPLRGIDGFAQILVEDYAGILDGEGRRLLGVVQENARRMGQLIHDLLAFSQLGRRPLDRTTVPVGEVVQEVLDSMEQTTKTGVEFEVGDLPEAQGDRAMLRQVFANLLDNAVKYSSSKADPKVVVDGAIAEDGTHFWVTDNGIGFEPKYGAKIFGVFERLHPPERFSGTGVGLSLVQRIVLRHGGSVWGEGNPQQGATFHVRLPVRPDSPGAGGDSGQRDALA